MGEDELRVRERHRERDGVFGNDLREMGFLRELGFAVVARLKMILGKSRDEDEGMILNFIFKFYPIKVLK